MLDGEKYQEEAAKVDSAAGQAEPTVTDDGIPIDPDAPLDTLDALGMTVRTVD